MTKFEELMLILTRDNIHFTYERDFVEECEWIWVEDKFTALASTKEDNGPILIVDERYHEDLSEDFADWAAKRIERILGK